MFCLLLESSARGEVSVFEWKVLLILDVSIEADASYAED